MADKKPFVAKHGFAVANSTLTVFGSNGKLHANNTISNATITDAMLASTFTTESAFNSALANTNLAIADRLQVANASATYQTIAIERAALANTNSYIADQATRIDLVNTNLTGTNTALRTLIDDRIQVANADTRFLRKDGTAAQSVGGQVTFNNNVLISGNLTVSGTKTEVNTTQVNVSNTYILLNSDLGGGTAATENAGIIVNRGAEANVYFRWNETGEYWEYGEADGTFTKISEAAATTIQARNESGGTINFGQPVSVSGYSAGGERPLVELADADDPAQMPALGLALDTVSTGNNLRVATYGVISNANTGVFSVGQELYVDTVAGKLTGTRPTGNTVKVQKIGQVLRSHASAGSILIQGAGRSNDVPNLENKHVFIGNTTNGVDTRALVVSDISNSDTLATNAALQTEVTRIDLVNTNLTGTNTALRTLISDRLQVANASATYQTIAIERAALANTNLAISDRLQVANAITTLAGLNDVAQVTPSDGQVLKYSTSNTTYYFADGTITSSSLQATTANGTQTTFTSPISTSDPKDVLVTIDGVLQIPTTDYSISGTTVTISPAPLSDSVVVVRTGGIPVATQLQDLSDIAQVTPTDGHVLKYSSANSTYYFAAESGAAGGVSNAYLTSTFTTNATFQSALANTNLAIADRLQVANAAATYQTISVERAALANTNLAISDRLQVANATLLINDRYQVANVDTNFVNKTTSVAQSMTANLAVDSTGSTSGVHISNGAISIFTDTGNPSFVDFYCEVSNLHYARLQSQPHSAYGGSVTVKLPVIDGVLATTTDLATVNTSVNTQATRIDLVNTNLTGTNTALRTLISDRLQVANAITTLAGLTDVAQVTPTDGHVLTYSSSNTTYYFSAAAGGASVTVSNTAPTSPSEGDLWFDEIDATLYVRYGAAWIDAAPVVGSSANNIVFYSANNTLRLYRTDGIELDTTINISGGSLTLAGLTDVAQVTPTDGHVLKYSSANSTYYFAAETGGGGSTPTFSDLVVTTFTANGTQTAFSINNDVTGAEDLIVTLDGVIQRPTTDYTFASNTVTFGTAPINGEIVAIREIKAIGQQIVSGVSNSQFQSYVANTNARLVTLEAGGGGSGDVSNAYLTSTFTTNAVFQSALANTNARLVTLEGGGGGGGNSFSVIEIGGTLIDSAGSTARLSIDAGSGIALTPTAGNNTILIESTGGGIGGDTSSSYQVTTANGTQTTFTSPVSSSDAKAVFVTIDGVVQTPTTDYTISGTTVTTDEAPDSGSVVVIRAGVFYADSTSIIDASTSIATANGTATTFTSPISSTNADRVLVSVDGVIQRPTTDYTISGTVVTFDTAPPNGTIVMVRSIATASQVQELTDLTNVANTTPTDGQVLKYASANSTFYFDEGGASTGKAIAMAIVFG